jgi:nucleoside-diphosphate-sugar epimerase
VKIFVAGATGVLGRRAVTLLVADGHQVSGIARSARKAEQLTAAGALPVDVDLFDPAGIAAAVAGHDVVANLATHIPDLAKAARLSAWAENDRIRTEGARNLVDGALAGGASRYLQESISFFYVDSGEAWVDEDTPMQPPSFARTFQSAEQQAKRFSDAGQDSVVLRFGLFYAADSPQTQFQLTTARHGVAGIPGPKDKYQSFIHVDDAASAVVAALRAPSGVYNVTEIDPLRRVDANAAIAGALGVKHAISIPGLTRLGGSKTEYFNRSLRISSQRFRDATGWAPAYPSPREGWAQVVAESEQSHQR